MTYNQYMYYYTDPDATLNYLLDSRFAESIKKVFRQGRQSSNLYYATYMDYYLITETGE